MKAFLLLKHPLKPVANSAKFTVLTLNVATKNRAKKFSRRFDDWRCYASRTALSHRFAYGMVTFHKTPSLY